MPAVERRAGRIALDVVARHLEGAHDPVAVEIAVGVGAEQGPLRRQGAVEPEGEAVWRSRRGRTEVERRPGRLLPCSRRVGLAAPSRGQRRRHRRARRKTLRHGMRVPVGDGGGADALQTVDRLDEARGVHLARERRHRDGQERTR